MAANVAPKAVNSHPASPAQGAGLRAAEAQQTLEGHLRPPPVKGPGQLPHIILPPNMHTCTHTQMDVYVK